MNADFYEFVIAHELLPAADEITARAAAGIEELVRFGRFAATDDAEDMRRLAARAAVVARFLPDAPPPATDSGLASPGLTHEAVLRWALDRLAEKLCERDAGGYIRPVDAACDVADLAQACAGLAEALRA